MAFQFTHFHHQALGLEINLHFIIECCFFSSVLPHQHANWSDLLFFSASFLPSLHLLDCSLCFCVSVWKICWEIQGLWGKLCFFFFYILSYSFPVCLQLSLQCRKLPSHRHTVTMVTTSPPRCVGVCMFCVCTSKSVLVERCDILEKCPLVAPLTTSRHFSLSGACRRYTNLHTNTHSKSSLLLGILNETAAPPQDRKRSYSSHRIINPETHISEFLDLKVDLLCQVRKRSLQRSLFLC